MENLRELNNLLLTVMLMKLLTAVHYLVISASAVAIDNGIIGNPEVQCGGETVELRFRTKNPFRGKVFVKGHYNNPECRVDFGLPGAPENADVSYGKITVTHGACDMERQRMINPQGIEFTAVVVVSFHKVFITKVDRAYNVKCSYREANKEVSLSLDVSMLTTQTLFDASASMPICTYSIRRDKIDGDPIQYARVGDPVVHRWECDSDMYGMLVHSCQVEDGQGEKILVLDENGCQIDQYVLGEPTYVQSLNTAYREAHVVKFADRVAVQFACQIKLCLKMDNQCQGITPPQCQQKSTNFTTTIPVVTPATPGTYRARTRPSQPKIYRTTTGLSVYKTTTGRNIYRTPSENETVDQPLNVYRTSPLSENIYVTNANTGAVEKVRKSLPNQQRFAEPLPDELLPEQQDNVDINDLIYLREKRSLEEAEPSTTSKLDQDSAYDGDLKSQTLYVIDTTEDPSMGTFGSFFEKSSNSDDIDAKLITAAEICLTRSGFSGLMATLTLLFLIATLIIVLICFRRTVTTNKLM